jgi:hypothetical protein
MPISHQRTREIVDKHGRMLMMVRPSEGDPPDFPPIIYTIGNHERGLPELLFIASTIEGFAPALNELGRLQRERGQGFRHGEIIKLGGTYSAPLLNAGPAGRSEYAVQVGEFYRTDAFEVMQVVFPDPDGNWPGDPTCTQPYSSQPILAGGTIPGVVSMGHP